MFDEPPIIIRTGNPSGTEWTGSAALITPEPWVRAARCTDVDPDMFFPSPGDNASVKAARAVCDECLVAAHCLDYARRVDARHGIWGGLTASERDALARGKKAKKQHRKCQEPGCARRHHAKGLCIRHYQKQREEGAS